MPEKNPTVSVIIPTYNRAHLIGRAIQSILNQTYQDFEVIVVDDGSIDSTEEVIKEFQEHDKRIKYIRHEKNRGGAAARNTGIKVARGEYIAFQDSDDEWLPEKLERQMDIFQDLSKEIAVVYTDVFKIERGKIFYEKGPSIMPEEGAICKRHIDLRVKGIFLQSSVIRRKSLNIVGMLDENLRRYHDLDLFIRLAKKYSFYHINEPLVRYYYKCSIDNIASNEPARIKALTYLLEKYKEEFSRDRKLFAKILHDIGISECRIGEFKVGRRKALKAVKTDPFNIRFIISALLLLLGEDIYKTGVEVKKKFGQKLIDWRVRWREKEMS